MPFLRKKFTTFHDFATASLSDIYTESCLDECLVTAGAYHCRVGPPSEYKRHGIKYDRFAGSSFAGQHVQTRAEFDPGLGKDCQVSNMKVAQHG